MTDESLAHELEKLKSDIFACAKAKNSPPYDFWTLLLKYKFSELPVEQLTSEEGLNILQICLERGRLSFLQSIFNTGWWTLLTQQKVPEWGPTEYRGKRAKDIAQAKRARKPLDEYNEFCSLDVSMSPVMKAIRTCDISRTRSLMQNAGEELFYVDNNKANALYWAVVSGCLDIFMELLSLGVDYHMVTKKRENLLHVACVWGRHEFVAVLVKQYQVEVWLEDTGHKTPLDR